MSPAEVKFAPEVIREVSDYHCDQIMKFCHGLTGLDIGFNPRQDINMDVHLLRTNEIAFSHSKASPDSKIHRINPEVLPEIIANEMYTLGSFSKTLFAKIVEIGIAKRHGVLIPTLSISNPDTFQERQKAVKVISDLSGFDLRVGILQIDLGDLNEDANPVKFLRKARKHLKTVDYNIQEIYLRSGDIKRKEKTVVSK